MNLVSLNKLLLGDDGVQKQLLAFLHGQTVAVLVAERRSISSTYRF